MEKFVTRYIESFLSGLVAKNPGEAEFHQAVGEVVKSLASYIEMNPYLIDQKILERMTEAERIVIFRVPWVDDAGVIQVNRGFRVQMNSAIGPYKGGLRFHPSVNLSIMKFLAFEQTFKNALTTLPMGGAKGGSDFNPRGKSDAEVMRFCQSFMTELYRHIGQDTDIPAGDMGVGGREIGYLFGQYKRLKDRFTGVLTGKGIGWGGSLLRPEATGYGLCYFAEEMLATRDEGFNGKTVLVSGAGNVAQYAAQKAMRLGAKVVTLSDSDGFILDPDGLDEEKMNYVFRLKNFRRGRISEYAKEYPTPQYFPGQKPWGVPCDIALRGRCQGPHRRRLPLRSRRRQHAFHARRHPRLPERRHPLCARQGFQRRRRGHLRPGDEPELRAPALDQRGSGQPVAPHHERHPRRLLPVRQGGRRYHQLRKGCQRGRLHESGRRHD